MAKLPPPPPPSAQGAAAEGGEGQEGEEGPPALLAAPLGDGLGPEEQRRARLHAEVVHRGQALQLFESLQVCTMKERERTFTGWATIVAWAIC